MTQNLLLLLLASCNGADDPVEDRWILAESMEFTPMAAWDPFTFDAEVERESWEPAESWREEGYWHSSSGADPEAEDLEPVVFDADGAEVPIEWAVDDRAWAWVPVDGWEPGATYSVEARLRRTTSLDIVADAPLSFTVGTFGRDAAFTADSVVGRVYAMESSPSGPGVEGLALGQAGELRLQVLAVDGEAASFRVWTTLEEQTCEVLRSVGTLSAEGELFWTAESITADSDPGPLRLWDTTIRLGFSGDGEQIAGLYLGGGADVAPFEGVFYDGDSCELLLSFGTECEACPDDGDVACVYAEAWWGTMQATEEPDPGDLPMCGVEIDPDLGSGGTFEFSCDTDWQAADCDCAAGSRRGLPMGVLLFVGVGLARRRRGPAT
jgi:hypothetical protein